MIRFVCPLILVDDINASRKFYEEVLDQKVKDDFGENIFFEGGFAIHLREHYESLPGMESMYKGEANRNDGEFYFETEDIDDSLKKLKNANVKFIHEIIIQPWQQRVIRFFDPDKHIIEIGETMNSTVERLYKDGDEIDAIANKTSLARDFIEHMLNKI
jgi:catechol 2,3-dioxygenase-like lactoylglutathione lyase family enzyme